MASESSELHNVQNWTNPFPPGQPLHRLFDQIVRDKRDIIVIIDDAKGRRGTGKTVASIQLANAMDQTPEGLTWEKCSLQPEEIRNAYANQPKRSGLILDEAEFGASNRSAMTNTNKALREIMSMGRVEEKYLVVNAPIKEFIDTDIQKLADVWISMKRKGYGVVHFLEWNPYAKRLFHPKKQYIEFDDIPRGTNLRDVYNKLTKEKRRRIGGEEGTAYITESDHQDDLEKARKQARQDHRDECIRRIAEHPETDLPDRVVGDLFGISQQHAWRIRTEGENDE